jgi:hypothetical protein
MSETTISLLDEVKLQAAVILPILRSLRAEVGKEKADRIVGDSLRTWARDLYHRIGESKPGSPRQKWDAVWAEDMRPRIGDAVDRDMLKDDGAVREYNITRCQYAEFFRGLGEPELGGILLCDSDFHIADVAGSSIEFNRTQTIMQGAAYCDFRYRFK